MLSCPPLPQVLTTVWQKSNPKTGVPRTDPAYYWRCCFDEIVKAQRALGLQELNRLFADRLKSHKMPTTGGHESWLRNGGETLLHLFAAANLEIQPGTKFCGTVSTYWRVRQEAVLAKLTQWVNENPGRLEKQIGRASCRERV